MKKIALLIVMILLAGSSLYAQTQGFEFTEFKKIPGGKVVYFKLSGLTGTEQAEKIRSLLAADSEISFCRIIDNNWCQLNISEKADANYIRNLLLSAGVDYDPGSPGIKKTDSPSEIPVNSSTGVRQRTDGMPDDYPVYVNTANPVQDDKRYDEAKQKWINEHPQEYKEINTPKN